MIKVIAVGKLKEKAMDALVKEYCKRLGAFTKIEIIEVPDEQAPQNNSQLQNEAVKKKEGERILAKVKEQEYMILLDLQGKMLSSEALAEHIAKVQTYQSSDITFVIGGSLGLSEEVIQRANYRWKISDLTFPHQLVRVMILEQIYRAYMINNHMPYHK